MPHISLPEGLPGITSAFAYRPETAKPMRELAEVLLRGPNSLTSAERETIATFVSHRNECHFCMPGVGIAQGEGNRDTPILRGNSTTSDFFVDGVRDDVQYIRDFYNVERVEALKGPNAMAFGRGGGGGVINRVTKEAGFTPLHEVTVMVLRMSSRLIMVTALK